MSKLAEIIKADFTAAGRRPDELVFIFVTAIAAGVIGSFAGKLSLYLVALLTSQISAYLYVIRDWDRGVLEGLVYYVGHGGVYISKLATVSALSMGSTAVASIFIDPLALSLALIASFLLSSLSCVSAIFSIYGGLPPPAATAMAVVLALPALVKLVELSYLQSLAMAVFVSAIGLVVSSLLDM